MKQLIPSEVVEKRIFYIRQQKVMLSTDLAELYGVTPKALIQAVKRNLERFPEDFMFQLSNEEFGNLRSQFVTANWAMIRTPPYAFTEHGIAMLSSVLKSSLAIQMNISIIRAFIGLRELLSSNKNLNQRMIEMEKKYDWQFKLVFDAIKELTTPPVTPKRKIGI
jgi:hypothetical protein